MFIITSWHVRVTHGFTFRGANYKYEKTICGLLPYTFALLVKFTLQRVQCLRKHHGAYKSQTDANVTDARRQLLGTNHVTSLMSHTYLLKHDLQWRHRHHHMHVEGKRKSARSGPLT